MGSNGLKVGVISQAFSPEQEPTQQTKNDPQDEMVSTELKPAQFHGFLNFASFREMFAANRIAFCRPWARIGKDREQ